MTHEEFIEAVAEYVIKYAPQYGILVNSPIIAQTILESNWGDSKLSAQYHNYFGLKTGSNWTGKAVNLKTSEEYTPGVHTQIRDDFRVYDSMEDGIKGYFDFIQYPRYKNLKGITDPQDYLETIREDGYATSYSYVQNNMALIKQYNLTKYDEVETMPSNTVTAETILNTMRSWIGLDRATGTHHVIIDTYNSYTPRARGYKVTYQDEYCDTTVSAAFIKNNAVSLIGGTECGVEEHIKIFKAAGIWIEDGSITPKVGDIITYNWDDSTQPNDGYADHIGIVEKVNGSTITVIEGNMSGKVGRRNISVGWGYIRGYARPKYSSQPEPAPEPSDDPHTVKYYASVRDCAWLNVRQYPGKGQPLCKTFGPLPKGSEVGVCSTTTASNGDKWYLIKYNTKFGYCSAKYIY